MSADAPSYRSGLPWSDGVFATHNAVEAASFASWRGRPVDNVLAFTSREDWDRQLNDWWAATVPATFDPVTDDFVIGVPLWTDDGDLGSTAQWSALAELIEQVDSNALVRLGWEMNCCFSKVTDVQEWKAQYVRAASAMRSAAPGLDFVFNPNEGPAVNGVTVQADEVYPGDAYVDVVAIDAYDWYPAYTSRGRWREHRDGEYGWKWWLNFARAHGKPFGLGEFGLYSASSASGGDNPRFFFYVYRWLRYHASRDPGIIRFVTVYNEQDDSWYGGRLHPTTRNPQAAQEYRTQLRRSAAIG